MDMEALARQVVDCGFEVHKGLGPGLLESVYELVLAKAIERRGFHVERQRPISFTFDSMNFSDAFRADLLVEGVLIIEVKSVEQTLPVHGKQVLTYLRLLKQPLGLLINFGGETLKEGLRRVVNNHKTFAPSRLGVNK